MVDSLKICTHIITFVFLLEDVSANIPILVECILLFPSPCRETPWRVYLNFYILLYLVFRPEEETGEP